MKTKGGRNARHRLILEILASQEIANQEELSEVLAGRGVEVTQPTLSRDLRDLRVERVRVGDGHRYVAPGGGSGVPASPPLAMRQVAQLEARAVTANETMVLVHTWTGHGNAIGVYIDGLGLADILGTIAGDDTVLVIPRSVRQTAALRDELADLLRVS